MAKRATRANKTKALKTGGSWVYFIEMPAFGVIKIGWTGTAVPQRFHNLQTGCPAPIRIVAVAPGGQGTEANLHEFFDEHCVHGEWFRDVPAIREYIASEAIPWTEFVPEGSPGGRSKVNRRALAKLASIEEWVYQDYEERCEDILGYIPRLPHRQQVDLLLILRTAKALKLRRDGLSDEEISEAMGFPNPATGGVYARGIFRNGHNFRKHENP